MLLTSQSIYSITVTTMNSPRTTSAQARCAAFVSILSLLKLRFECFLIISFYLQHSFVQQPRQRNYFVKKHYSLCQFYCRLRNAFEIFRFLSSLLPDIFFFKQKGSMQQQTALNSDLSSLASSDTYFVFCFKFSYFQRVSINFLLHVQFFPDRTSRILTLVSTYLLSRSS